MLFGAFLRSRFLSFKIERFRIIPRPLVGYRAQKSFEEGMLRKGLPLFDLNGMHVDVEICVFFTGQGEIMWQVFIENAFFMAAILKINIPTISPFRS